ncbi:1674_t:CDS:10, partial [Entrophospora sp. SA101]
QYNFMSVNLINAPPIVKDLEAPPPPINMPSNQIVTRLINDLLLMLYENPFNKSRLPFGLIITPYRSLKEGEEPVPVITDAVIARCRRCRTYINPFVSFTDGGQKWGCNMCYLLNEETEEEKRFKNQLKKEHIPFYDYKSFHNIQSIDNGGFGRIYCAYSKHYQGLIALKSVDIDQRYTFEQFLNEAKQHRKVERHSNILKFYGITREEYANNGNLSNYLKSNFNTMDWNVKLKFARQIASAVNHLHENKIVHRDLHSKNILIHNGNIKICDFGIAKFLLDPSLEVSKRLGSIKYSDPQYLNNTKNYSHLTLAIILGEREAIIKGTPKKYAKIYTECWQGKPDLRPHIHQVMQDLCNVDITDIVEDTDQTNNELQNDDLLHSKEIPLSAQIDSLNNQLKDLDKAQAGIAEILQLYYGEFLFHHTKVEEDSWLFFTRLNFHSNNHFASSLNSNGKVFSREETEQNYEVDQNQPQIEETDVNCEPRREETEDNSDGKSQYLSIDDNNILKFE